MLGPRLLAFRHNPACRRRTLHQFGIEPQAVSGDQAKADRLAPVEFAYRSYRLQVQRGQAAGQRIDRPG